MNVACYMQDAQTQVDLAESGVDLDGALNAFVLALQGVLRGQGKTPIVKEGERLFIVW